MTQNGPDTGEEQIPDGAPQDPQDVEETPVASEPGLFEEAPVEDGPYEPEAELTLADEVAVTRRTVRDRFRGCLPVLVVFAVLLAGAWYGGRWAYDEISTRIAPAADFEGPGTGSLIYQVEEGVTSTDIARDLKAEGVVASVEAFTAAARENEKSRSIQVGYYELKKEMRASEALEVLVDPGNLLQSLVTVPEGARVEQVAATIAKRTDIPRGAVNRALANPQAIGLPEEAKGNPEGYLFPATYSVPPKQTAVGLLSQMVAKGVEVRKALDLETRASEVGLSPREVITVASIMEYEVNRSEDYPKVARVIYNRLEEGMPLQMDSTVAYISKRSGDVFTTQEERQSDSPYNTYRVTGLPPGPIGSPGRETLEAALDPAAGDWVYFVADVEEGVTRFSSTLSEHNKWVSKLQEYCRKSEDC